MGYCHHKNYIYCIGGYSFEPEKNYQQPNYKPSKSKTRFQAYDDGYYLNTITETWHKLPNLPIKITNLNLICNRSNLYAICGTTIDTVSNSKDLGLDITIIANQIWKLQLNENTKTNSWEKYTKCPGTYRMDASVTLVDNLLYIIGGSYPNNRWNYHSLGEERYYNIKDNWVLNLDTLKWNKLASHNYNISNWANNQIYMGGMMRYIYLIGCSYYYKTLNCNRTHFTNNNILIQGPMGQSTFKISKDIYKYDIQNNTFEFCGTLPFPINKPKWILENNIIYIMGGECSPSGSKYHQDQTLDSEPIEGYFFDNEFFGYHLDLFIYGKIK
jgi:N-acetylneuraminic acid mutarotase